MSSIQATKPQVFTNRQATLIQTPPAKTTEKNPDSPQTGLTREDKLEILDLTSKTGNGLLIGGMASTFAQAVASAELRPAIEASPAGFALGAAIGAGVGLIKAETKHEDLKPIKNTVGGALIGGGTAGILTSAASTLIAAKSTWAGLPSTLFFGYPAVSATAIGVGAAIGAGIAIYASQKK